SWTEILAHYYRSTALSNRAPETIRVLLEDSADVAVTAPATFSVWWSGGAKIADSTQSEPFLRALYSGSGVVVQRAAQHTGPWTTIATGAGPAVFKPGTQWMGLIASGGSVRYYRGEIEARRIASTSSMLAINIVGMEPYLYGVVPREMPSGWDGDALRAQAVAARSYAARKKDNARSQGSLYDICITTSCQVYGGYARGSSPGATPEVLETAQSNDAVNATAGKVLTYDGSVILAEYSSSTGGYTATSSQPWQQAVPDPTDSVSPHHSWSTRIGVPAIQGAFPEVGSLVDVRVTQRNGYGDWGGRATQVVVQGTSASTTVGGSTFRIRTGLKSDWFRIRIYRGELVSISSSVSGPSGTAIPVVVALRNAGGADWGVGGRERLATWSPSGRQSRFTGPGWIDATRPSAVTKNLSRPSASTVGPGETAEFRFYLHTGSVSPGTYVESFRPLMDGTTWMPDVGIGITVNVLSSWVEEAGNMATNPSFEAGWSAWSGTGIRAGDGPATGTVRAGTRSMHLAGGGRKSVVQRLSLTGGGGRRIVIGGWARTVASGAGGGPVSLNLALRNADGTTTWNQLDFGRGPHDWQYAERVVVSAKRFLAADLYASFHDQTGRVYFDGLRVMDTHVANPSFDLGTGSWRGSGLGAGDGPSSTVFRDGFRSLHLNGGTKSLTQRIPIRGPGGRMYLIGGWTKADRANGAGGTFIAVQFNNTDGTTSRTSIPATPGDHGWEYVERHVAAAKRFNSIEVIVSTSAQTGSIFFDGIRLRETRLPNGSFETGLAPWRVAGTYGASDGVVDTLARDALKSHKVAPSAGSSGVTIHLDSGGPAGASVLLGGWNRTTGTGGRVWLSLGFRNRDGTTTWRNLFFSDTAHDWVHQEVTARADKPYGSIDVFAMENNSPGEVFFDGVTLWALV
ncbi:MAG: SpoIID/LytB domain-containing protein, partial [Actinomycetota bacterium]